MTSNPVYIAHVRTTDQQIQTVSEHLSEVAEIAEKLAAKINVPEAGEIIGLLHDFGKYSTSFQDYIKSGTGLLNPDIDDDYVDAKAKKGKIDHSTAGAQWLWQALSKYGKNGEGKLCAQILALCIVSHHGKGLIDCLQTDGANGFEKRIKKPDDLTHLSECTQNADQSIKCKAKTLANVLLVETMFKQLRLVVKSASSETIRQFYMGFWTRFLFSCLIDADRINSADFENPEQARHRNQGVSWPIAIDRLESFLAKQQNNTADSAINAIRRDISDTCKNRATQDQGIYTLTVPTGGGKTYASLRFALHHAEKHNLERIIYIIPYTSIIEQNANAIRKAVEQVGDDYPWVLEHHSNLEPEQQTWHSKLVAENWDAPIVMTTMVQFLETLFSGGTRGVRRLHQLANSIIIFDEVQTLPINCTHLFCNALNFLTLHAKTTAVLCTATQPLLDKLPEKTKANGQLQIPPENELVADVGLLFEQLKRVNISNKTKPEGWSVEEITDLALSEFKDKGNCLVIVNTKAWAQALYVQCSETVDKAGLFHLSTHQCSAHRSELFQKMRERLTDNLPVLCFSTQLIEAGVDIDFASVIRFLAGLDSIAQAAGRCNRNGRMATATVHVVNPAQETIDQLIDIKVGQEKTKRVFHEVNGDDLLAPEVMARYFDYYFYERADQMVYPLTAQEAGRTDSLLNLLSENKSNIGKNAPLHLKQSFMTAGAVFKAIDAPTYSVIVPYGQGNELIKDLCGIPKQFDAKRYFASLKQAQKYSVNVFPNVWKKLLEQQAVIEIQGEGIYYLDERYYSPEFGLSTEPVGKFEINIL
ncbi:CRISPR-associated helicase Cas3' [Methylovulum psychrotolerans]|uniref:CRISPR-associated helicase Cas3' n=1 Tax=Methylovulum psychrotolerans TaxID=1704499 RepID=UPI001BFF0361|nr:CRISPR-associated helicase Cas3' [Methylovulum psychrotolerans]MBT9100585.1 CRISPR-associated helicase Cas3' [Methylovulum psychrotolerans]